MTKPDQNLVRYLVKHPGVLDSSSAHEKDLTVPCSCGAGRGRQCKGLPSEVVHFSRRLKRLLKGIR